MTIKLEQLFDNSASDRNFRRLQELVGLVTVDSDGFGFTVGSVGIRFGPIGAINAATLTTITHGLGRTPGAVFTQAANGQVALGVDLVGATTFRVANSSATNTSGYWVVIG